MARRWVTLVLAIVGAAALRTVKKEQSVRSGEPPQEVPPSVAGENCAQEDCHSSEEIPSATVDIPVSPKGPQPPYRKRKTERQSAECRDRWRLGIEVVALALGFFGLIGLLFTLRETIKATRAATDAAHAAKTQAESTSKQVSLQEQTTRARLVAVDMEPASEIKSGAFISFRVFVKNIGGSPAFKVWWRGTVTQCAPAEDDECFRILRDPGSLTDPKPLGTIAAGGNESTSFVLGSWESGYVDDPQSEFVVYGRLQYDDIFMLEGDTIASLTRPPQRTWDFCFVYFPHRSGPHPRIEFCVYPTMNREVYKK